MSGQEGARAIKKLPKGRVTPESFLAEVEAGSPWIHSISGIFRGVSWDFHGFFMDFHGFSRVSVGFRMLSRQVLKQLDHPNICKLYEVFEDSENIYLVMDLCRGGELFDRITQGELGGEQQVSSLIRQLAHAVRRPFRAVSRAQKRLPYKTSYKTI